MYLLLQGPGGGIGVGGFLVVLLLLVAMVIPVLVVLGIALYVTRDEWGDRSDFVGTDADPVVREGEGERERERETETETEPDSGTETEKTQSAEESA
ncbi:hypothetical protein [Haloarcula marina]|uniref:hypothetical protein n=1 Tax=Haloarcula marina TaxID=2961574 RepID=UPI0020B6F136|nr:hypothetical protein [Halomicroarcula marina]